MTANPFAALSGTGISCHLGAWRESATEKKPPEEYIVYTLMLQIGQKYPLQFVHIHKDANPFHCY